MRQIDAMTFRGALKILGKHDHSTLDKIDNALGGAILLSGALLVTGPTAAPLVALGAIWGWVDQKSEAIGLVRKLLDAVAGRRKHLVGYERTELIAAAHTVLVTSSLMETLREHIGEKKFKEFALSKDDQRFLTGQDLLDEFYGAAVPAPSGGVGFHENVGRVLLFQRRLFLRFIDFCDGLDVWQDFRLNFGVLADQALERYQSRYHQLAAEVPEFMIWALLGEHDASRTLARDQHQELVAAFAENSVAFSRLESLLNAIETGTGRQRDLAEIVRGAALSELDAPILPLGSGAMAHNHAIRFPSIRNIYVEPHYRIVTFGPDVRISDERWWDNAPVYDDLDVRLTGYFAAADATRLPLLLLGHPGSGKSLFTKILAARLPNTAFTTVHVPLRHVTADAPIYLQIQEALDRSTHGRVDWHELTDQSDGTVRIVLLDGLDELLQSSERNRTTFLREVAEFQRREADLGRPVAVVVTSRSVVAERVDVPPDTTVIKLEDFDRQQVERWRQIWNRTNETGIARPLTDGAVVACGELATQPLLLLMIALYSADPDTPPIERGLSQTMLYRRLLENFAQREATKPIRHDPDELASYVRNHIRRLSIAALAMFNRGRQHVLDFELGEDLKALGLSRSERPELAGRELFAQFFFIYTAQTKVGKELTKQSYEFLHATFGEYLVAREIVEVLLETAETATSRRGSRDPDDNLLFALLSHQCMAGRLSIMIFAEGIFAELSAAERDAIARVLQILIGGCRQRHGSEVYAGYRPTEVDRVRELAMYLANLVLLRLLIAYGGVPLADLWPGGTHLEQWRSTLSLWRSGIDDNGFYALLFNLCFVEDGLFVGRENSGSADIELMHAVLSQSEDLVATLLMGRAIRVHSEYPGRPAEELARWIIPSLAYGSVGGSMAGDRLTLLMTSIGSELERFEEIFVRLLAIGKEFEYDLLKVIATCFSALGPGDDMQYALFAAMLMKPDLLSDVPLLADPSLYTKMSAMKILALRAQRRREGYEESPEFAALYDGIEEHWRQSHLGSDTIAE
jgi:NACHT conflict system protein